MKYCFQNEICTQIKKNKKTQVCVCVFMYVHTGCSILIQQGFFPSPLCSNFLNSVCQYTLIKFYKIYITCQENTLLEF